jgi:23S rRNA (cytidine2498-2'-O)-methyltransferase
VAFTVEADPKEIAKSLISALEPLLSRGDKPWVLEVWVPDSDVTNRLLPFASSLEAQVAARIREQRPDLDRLRSDEPNASIRQGGVIAEVCVASRERVMVGALLGHESPTVARGGRARARMPRGSPSRAARKLVEAFDWTQRAPEPGETAVDLGAAPGGWTTVLLERRCRIVAIDPGALLPELAKNRAVEHLKISAFDYEPDEPVDWLFCDMAWRPLEVASLIAKWGRRRWASAFIANIKLPMKRRAEFVERVLGIIEEGGWRDVKARQLYHDRFEVTVAGWRV